MALDADKSVLQMQASAARVLATTPALAEKVRAGSPGGKKGRDDGVGRDSIIAELQRQLDDERDKNRQLEDQFKYRVGSFVKRETQAKKTIDALERQLQDRTDDEHRQRMGVIRNMHDSVIGGLECIQNNTAKILQDQEKDLMRAFRARLQDVSKELESQRNKKGDFSAELQARHRRVVSELHASQELAQIFDKKNQQLAAENAKLQERLRTREDDRQCLLKELVLAKKENAKLKQQRTEDGKGDEQAQNRGSMSPGGKASAAATKKQVDQARLQATQNRAYEREIKFREAITQLKRLLEQERHQVRQLRESQGGFLAQRTELEILLRQCLDDVKTEIGRKRAEVLPQQDVAAKLPKLDGTGPGASVSVHELTSQDRERVLELLLSQQRVVQLLYSKTFPNRPPTPPGNEADGPPQDDLAWLSDVMGESG